MIKNKENLEHVLTNSDRYIVYGAGLVGASLVQYLIKAKMSSKLICIAVKSKDKNPSDIMGIPVCELDELGYYKEKCIFLIATLEYLHMEIVLELENFGCEKIFGISDLFYTIIREEVNDFTPDILCLLRKNMQKLDKIKEELIYKIEEQNEISIVNTKAFGKYKNCFRGRDLVLLATGPSLNEYKPMENAIHIGINTTYKNPKLSLDFLFVQDGRPAFLEEKFKGIEDVKCKVFVGRLPMSDKRQETVFPENYRLGENISDYMLESSGPDKKIYKDICNHAVSGWISVVFSALHFAFFTYPKRIFLVGCDVAPTGYYDGSIDKDCLIHMQAANKIKEGYRLMKRFGEIYYPDTEIISINPVGLKGMFQDIYTDKNIL